MTQKLAPSYDRVNASPYTFFALNAHWEEKVREHYQANGVTFSSAVTRFLGRLAQSAALFGGHLSQHVSISALCKMLNLGRTQVKEHLRRACAAGVLKKIGAGQFGLRLQLLVTSVTSPRQPVEPAPVATKPERTPPPPPPPPPPPARDEVIERAVEIRFAQAKNVKKPEAYRAVIRRNMTRSQAEAVLAEHREKLQREQRKEQRELAESEKKEREQRLVRERAAMVQAKIEAYERGPKDPAVEAQVFRALPNRLQVMSRRNPRNRMVLEQRRAALARILA